MSVGGGGGGEDEFETYIHVHDILNICNCFVIHCHSFIYEILKPLHRSAMKFQWFIQERLK